MSPALLTPENLVTGFAIFLRTAAVCFSLPKLGADRYYLIYRAALALVVTLAVSPLVIGMSNAVPRSGLTSVPNFFSVAVAETGIGLSLGLAATITIVGLQAAGQIFSQVLGFQIGSLQRGLEGESATDYRKLFLVVGIFFWFSLSGHRQCFEALIRSFAEFPVGEIHFSRPVLDLFNSLIATCLEFALRFSLPVVVVGMTGFLLTGLTSRILGSGQATSAAFGVNQLLFFAISLPLIYVLYDQTAVQIPFQLQHFLSELSEQSITP